SIQKRSHARDPNTSAQTRRFAQIRESSVSNRTPAPQVSSWPHRRPVGTGIARMLPTAPATSSLSEVNPSPSTFGVLGLRGLEIHHEPRVPFGFVINLVLSHPSESDT